MRRTRLSRAAGMIIVSTLAMTLGASPALAGNHWTGASVLRPGHVAPAVAAVRKPDGRIRLGNGTASGNADPYVGNNVYNTTDAHQTSRADYYGDSIPGLTVYRFDIVIQNDGSKPDRFKVHATGAAATGWKVRYVRGSTNITSQVVAGTYETGSLAPTATFLIRAKVTLVSYTFGAGPKRLVTLTSAADGTKKDAVKFLFKLATCGC